MRTDQQQPVFLLHGPQPPQYPVLLSVPHCGRVYPEELIENLQLPARDLVNLEDRYADLLTRQAGAAGYSRLLATIPRAVIDLNRSPDEIDPDMIADRPRWNFGQTGPRVRHGLGLIPRRLPRRGELWRRKFTHADISERINGIHRPWHEACADMLRAIHDRFGIALLLDIHSMPPLPGHERNDAAQIVLGDLHGRSCPQALTELAGDVLSHMGYKVAVNAPYAGGYILDRHSDPARNIFGLQVEFDRSLYLDEAFCEPSAGLATLADHVQQLVTRLSQWVEDSGGYAMAAE